MMNLDIFVPPDEQLHPKKLLELLSNSINSVVQFIIPEANSLFKEDSDSFDSFNEILEVFSGHNKQPVKKRLDDRVKMLKPNEQLKGTMHAKKQYSSKFPLPKIIAGDLTLFFKLIAVYYRQIKKR